MLASVYGNREHEPDEEVLHSSSTTAAPMALRER